MTDQQKAIQITEAIIQSLSDGQLKAVSGLCEAILVDSDEQAVKSMEAINVLVGDQGDETMGFFIPLLVQAEVFKRFPLQDVNTEGRV